MITAEQIRVLAEDLVNVNLTLHVQDRLESRNIPFRDCKRSQERNRIRC